MGAAAPRTEANIISDTALAAALSILDDRNDFHHLNTDVEQDYQKLESRTVECSYAGKSLRVMSSGTPKSSHLDHKGQTIRVWFRKNLTKLLGGPFRRGMLGGHSSAESATSRSPSRRKRRRRGTSRW